MKIFNVYTNPNSPDIIEDAVLIPEGFSLWAFIFDFFWLLYHRLWLVALVFFIFVGILGYLEYAQTFGIVLPFILRLGLKVYIGFTGNDWRGFTLKRRGYVLTEVIAAKDETEAQYKFLSQQVQSYPDGRSEVTI